MAHSYGGYYSFGPQQFSPAPMHASFPAYAPQSYGPPIQFPPTYGIPQAAPYGAHFTAPYAPAPYTAAPSYASASSVSYASSSGVPSASPAGASSSSTDSIESSLSSRKQQLAAAQAQIVADEIKLHEAHEAAVKASGKRAASDEFMTGYSSGRSNPMTDRFESVGFLHMELIVGDAVSAMKRFRKGFGMRLIAKSDRNTGNLKYTSYVLQSNALQFILTSPSHPAVATIVARDASKVANVPHPAFDAVAMHNFHAAHGLGVRAIGISVPSVDTAWAQCTANGGKGVLPPTTLSAAGSAGTVRICEISAYGDVVLRFVETAGFDGVFLPGYERVDDDQESYGLNRIDHIVGNVPCLRDVFQYLTKMTGWHRFAEFTAEDVGTVDSGLNSVVIGNNNEMILMPINEPTWFTKKRSQIQVYLEHNSGAGVQHVAIKCDDIVATMTKLRAASDVGFEFLPAPPSAKDRETGKTVTYYEWVKSRAGKYISDELLAKLQAVDVLVDIDDQGILLQIFTKPLDDRPTLFFEIIQRLCFLPKAEVEEIGGCGGFGKGNFSALFAQIETDMGDIA